MLWAMGECTLACDSIQSHRALMYSGAVNLKGFLTLMPSAHKYSYCEQHLLQNRPQELWRPAVMRMDMPDLPWGLQT